MTLPQEIEKQISDRGDKLTENLKTDTPFNTGYVQGFIDGHESGATEWAGKAQPVVDIGQEIVMLFDPFRRNVLIPTEIIMRLSAALAKYKEVTNG